MLNDIYNLSSLDEIEKYLVECDMKKINDGKNNPFYKIDIITLLFINEQQ